MSFKEFQRKRCGNGQHIYAIESVEKPDPQTTITFKVCVACGATMTIREYRTTWTSMTPGDENDIPF